MANDRAGFNSSAVFTAAAAAYTANDVMDVAKEFTNIAPIVGGYVVITSASLLVSETGVQSGETSYRLYLYNVTPPSAPADNAAWDLPSGDRASFLGYVDLGTPVDLGSSLYVETNIINKQIKVAGAVNGGSIWGLLVTNGGFTATATARTVKLHSVAL